MAATGFLFILRETPMNRCPDHAYIFTADVSSGALGLHGAGCAKRRVFPAMQRSWKPGALDSRRDLCLLVFAQTGVCLVARNYTPRGIKGEIDLVGYDGKTLAFVEVRTRT